MFSWWSSLEPQGSQGGENVGEKTADGEHKTDVETCSDEGKTDKIKTEQNEETSQDSKASELDYAKDVAKNVGSKYSAPIFIVLVVIRCGSFQLLKYMQNIK